MTIPIDADGCPVVDLTVKIAPEHKIGYVILCDTSHVFEKAGAKTITVSKGNDIDNNIPDVLNNTHIRFTIRNRPFIKQWDAWSDAKGMDKQ